ncbi:multiple epidermal growth factor-like domains protein 10 [Littorina saxatilis]|uniref:multiple epidermal growth factor-like domains protein 10 n=1 Tax=Littorina saxatilis TaxID=31220 RepID=UPI0038B52CB0
MVCKPNYFGGTSCTQCPRICKYVCNHLYGCDTLVPWNVAIKKTATQSSVLWGDPSFAIDGLTEGTDSGKQCTATNPAVDGGGNRWFQVDLGVTCKVVKLYVHNRGDTNGNKLDRFDVFVENEGMLTLSSPTKKCAEHQNAEMENAAVAELTCDSSKDNKGQFVILVAPSPHLLEICEVRVIGYSTIVLEAGESCTTPNEMKSCRLDHICVNNTCKINVGSDCSGSKQIHCISGSKCDGGVCKIEIDHPCTGKELCRHGAACDPKQAKCKWKLRQKCQTGSCIAGSTCDSLSYCKLQVGDACADTLDCPAGSTCKSAPGGTKCLCSGNSSGLCDSQVGFAGGICAAGATKCLGLNLVCTDGECICKPGYTVFSADLSCKAAVNSACNTSPDCNTGMECVSGTCRVNTNEDCSNHPLLCKSGAKCQAGLCKMLKGATCTDDRGTECGLGTICTENKHASDTVKRCRLSPGQTCLGDDKGNCEEDSLCETNVCKLRFDSDCVGANTALCRSETSCDHSKCKYDLGHECATTSDCISTAVCDSRSHTCQAKKDASCLGSTTQCLSGATCLPQGGGMTCQCTVHPNVNQGSVDCEPAENAAGGSCTDKSCVDPNAICSNGICECGNSTTFERSNYTCGYGSGDDCRNDTSGCNSGTICDRSGVCLLLLGQSCKGRKRGMCSSGLTCEEDICKLFLNMDCTDNPDLCMRGTVCGVNKKCTLAVDTEKRLSPF